MLIASAPLLAGCAANLRTAVPATLTDQVVVAGIGRVRGWGDAEIPNFKEIAAERYLQIKATRPEILADKRHKINYLAISGGGADGAFGAGFLNGWTASGKRPQFEIVTGVSTGALIAPFAFLGPAYDRQLKEIYTHYSTDDLITKQVLAGLLGGSAVSDTKPLADLIARYVTRGFVRKVAAEHRKGRRLLVGTTNADEERPVIWDLGRIATKDTKEAVALFRHVLLASTALPGLFPPVNVRVRAPNGKVFQEMHIDGGVTDNTFLLPTHLSLAEIDRAYKVKWRRTLYVLANSKTAPSRKVVKSTALSIVSRSIDTLIRQQLEGDLLKLYLRAEKNKISFKLADVPVTFDEEAKEAFDKDYMGKLYKVGYNAALKGYAWKSEPPGL